MMRTKFKRRFGRSAALLLFLAWALPSQESAADVLAPGPGRLHAFDQPVAVSDDTRALVMNPANLAFMPGAELRWSAAFLDEAARLNLQGHAFAFGFPLPFIPLTTGLRVDAVNPTRSFATRLGAEPNYQWLTWGLAFRASRTSALGMTVGRTFSESPWVEGQGSWSFGWSQRPWDFLALGLTAQHVAASTPVAGPGLERAYVAGVVLRPEETSALEVGLESRLVDEDGLRAIPRATLGLELPSFGRIEGEVQVKHPFNDGRREWFASAGLSMRVNRPESSSELGVGTSFGDALGAGARGEFQNNLHTEVASRIFREPAGVPEEGYALRVRLEEGADARGQVALLRALWYVAEREPAVEALVFELRSAPINMAYAQELRDAIFHLRRHGKKVLCHLEDASGAAFYVCAAADRVLINPAGGLRFAGLRAQFTYFKGLLDKLGVRGDFVRIGDHKSAPEALTRTGATETARADRIDLLQQFEAEFVRSVGYARKLDAGKLREAMRKGPFIASEAREAGLVDGVAHDDELEGELASLVGRRLSLKSDPRVLRAPERFGNERGLAIIYVDGDMVDGRSSTVPLVGMRLVGSYTIADAIRQARENPQIAAVVLRVETGGGSAMGADVIWRELMLTDRTKPVIVSMGGAAASGGYYIAAPARRIFANPLTVTGSIGIFYGKADVAGLLGKIGVNVETYRTTPHADAESIFRPFTEAERTELTRKVGQFYDTFLSRVAEGRKLEKAAVDKVGQGRVWTGAQALSHGLVDELGGLRQALEHARKLAGLAPGAPVVELPPVETSLLGRLLGIPGVSSKALQPHGEARASASLPMPASVQRILRAVGPMLVYESDVPLARLEWASVEVE